tara:strand:+ start:589 stop:1848 length:1260 start_codon:yes stop_codon:yes gene_type:complete
MSLFNFLSPERRKTALPSYQDAAIKPPQGLLGSSMQSGLLGNPLLAVGTALLNPRQSFGQNLQQGFQNLMQQQMYKQEQERKNRADMIKLAPLIKQNQIKNIINQSGITSDSIKQMQAIDPIVTGNILKSIKEGTQSSRQINAMNTGGGMSSNPYRLQYETAISAGVEPGKLAAFKSIIEGIDMGVYDLSNPLDINAINQVASSVNRLIENVGKTQRDEVGLGIRQAAEKRAAEGDIGNQAEAQAATFLTRMLGANKRINSPAFDENGKPILIDGKPVSIADVANKPEISAKLAGIFGSTAENIFTSPNRQVYKNAAMDWITANLRKESGAVISEIEFERDFVKFFPQIGDSQKVIEAKRQARKNAEKGMRASAGKAIKRLPDLDQGNTTNQQQPNQQSNVGRTPTLQELMEEKRRRQQ